MNTSYRDPKHSRHIENDRRLVELAVGQRRLFVTAEFHELQQNLQALLEASLDHALESEALSLVF